MKGVAPSLTGQQQKFRLFDYFVAKASVLAEMLIRAALLAAILLRIAQRPQHVDKGQAHL